ncbi:MAG: hypothetical protein WC967_12650 [Balneolaceae bacterium]
MKCLNCDKEAKNDRLFCSVACRNSYGYELVKCEYCGKYYERQNKIPECWGQAYCCFEHFAIATRQQKKRTKCGVCGAKDVPLNNINGVALCPNCFSLYHTGDLIHWNKYLKDIQTVRKTNIKPKEVVVLIDTREQTPWDFDDFKTERVALTTGDYQIKGSPDLVLERKGTPEELWGNLLEGKRFSKEMERLSVFKYKYVICDFPIDAMLEIPWRIKKKSRRFISPRFAIRMIMEYEIKYGVHFIFSTLSSKDIVRSIIKRVIEN